MGNETALFTETLWTVQEAAHYLRLTPATVRAMARKGEIPAVKVGRVWRIDAARLRAHLETRQRR